MQAARRHLKHWAQRLGFRQELAIGAPQRKRTLMATRLQAVNQAQCHTLNTASHHTWQDEKNFHGFLLPRFCLHFCSICLATSSQYIPAGGEIKQRSSNCRASAAARLAGWLGSAKYGSSTCACFGKFAMRLGERVATIGRCITRASPTLLGAAASKKAERRWGMANTSQAASA